jgi:hypothetical protein
LVALPVSFDVLLLDDPRAPPPVPEFGRHFHPPHGEAVPDALPVLSGAVGLAVTDGESLLAEQLTRCKEFGGKGLDLFGA